MINNVSEKEWEEWKNWVNDSVAFYTNKINQLNEMLKDENLSQEERQIIESEKASATDEKKKWEQAQNELKRTHVVGPMGLGYHLGRILGPLYA
jgi:hypothetical protein